ncbi:MAG: hypothetical protein ACI89U_001137 [Gammaproteobacteria bacterium]|jgi:hypothetical protein
MIIESIKSSNPKGVCAVTAIAVALAVSSCGGGGGGGGEKAAVIKKTNLSLSWDVPSQRENEELLPIEEIQGCVVLYFRESEMIDSSTVFPDYINSFSDFVVNDSQIGSFISGVNLSEIISTGSPHTVLIPSSGISNHTFYDVQSDTYYFSVSCSDWDDLYSELSITVSINVP